MRRLAILSCFTMLFSCTGKISEELARPESGQIRSRISRGVDGDLVIAVTYSGGGAGDTVNKLLACPSDKKSCEVLANIDSNDNSVPDLVLEGSQIFLEVNKDDYIFEFKNFSRLMKKLEPGVIHLRYR